MRDTACMTKCVAMTRKQWREFFDKPIVEWGMFALGALLIILGFIIAPLPGRRVL